MAAPRTRGGDSWARDIVRTLATIVLAFVVVLVVWWVFLKVFGVDRFVGKRPGDIKRWLFDVDEAAENRRTIVDGMGRTLYDAGAGFAIGLAFSIVVAILFVMARPIEQAFLPVAMTLRTVPIVAITPLLARVFGRNLFGTIVVVSIVVFFPTLVLVTYGLRSASREKLDLMRAYNASSLEVLRRVRIPSAMPSIFAAAKISAPGAILGALLAEWFITGEGLGYEGLLTARAENRFNQVWATTIVLILISVIFYILIGLFERRVLRKYAPEQVAL
jgi:ABC-type nitrate/sulfonate/bicarbonate transport system permease component